MHTHKFRNYVTRCLGGTNNRPVAELSGPHELKEGDVVLLCSDGFWGPLAERPMVDTLFKEQAPLINHITKLANQAEATGHPESDNVTVVALRWCETNAKLEPTDFSMALSKQKRDLIEPPAEQVDVTQAIDDLRRFVDDIDME